MENIEGALCKSLWDGEDIDSKYNEVVGRAGGLLSIWKKNKFKVQDNFGGNGFVGVKGRWENQ